MKLLPSPIPDVVVIEPQVFGDDRGFFMETWHRERFHEAGVDLEFVQENHSRSSKGVLRGLHYQIRQAQGKLMRVAQGEVYDVAVDIRKGSATFGKWFGTRLSGENKRQMWVPPGFAHGFLTLSDTADFLYKCTDYYAPQEERSILWNDPDLDIKWPLDPSVSPKLSEKDKNGSSFAKADYYP